MGGKLYDTSVVLRENGGSILESTRDKFVSLGKKFNKWGSVKYSLSGAPEQSEEGVISLPLSLSAAYSLENPKDNTNPVVAVELFWQKFWVEFKPELPLVTLPVSYWGSKDDYRLPLDSGERPLFVAGDDVLRTLSAMFYVGKELNTVPNLDSRRQSPSIAEDPFHVRKDKYNLTYSFATGLLSQLEGPLSIPEVLHRLPKGANQEECPTLVLERAVEEACRVRSLDIDESLSLIVYGSERI